MIAAASGILLGLLFRFYVLIPATLALTLVCLITALSRGDQLGDILAATVLPAVCLQASYVVGLCLRDLGGKAPARAADAETGKQRQPRRTARQTTVALVTPKHGFWNR